MELTPFSHIPSGNRLRGGRHSFHRCNRPGDGRNTQKTSRRIYAFHQGCEGFLWPHSLTTDTPSRLRVPVPRSSSGRRATIHLKERGTEHFFPHAVAVYTSPCTESEEQTLPRNRDPTGPAGLPRCTSLRYGAHPERPLRYSQSDGERKLD